MFADALMTVPAADNACQWGWIRNFWGQTPRNCCKLEKLHYHPIAFSRRGAERQSSQRILNFRPLLSLMQTALKLLDGKINFTPVLSALSASLREICMGCY